MTTGSSHPISQTQVEISSQPEVWRDSFSQLREQGTIEQVLGRFAPGREWLFVGCGTSYYLAQAAAATWTALGCGRGWAAPASDVLLFPELVLGQGNNLQAVFISRSGQTSEILQAAELAEQKFGLRTLGVTCAEKSAMEDKCTETIRVSPADEKSTVMTRSFTSMLLVLQVLAGRAAGNPSFVESLEKLPEQVEPLVKELPQRIRQFAESHDFMDSAYLGQGPLYPIAQEATLKLTEMSASYAQSFHTLEFRHGPRSIAGPAMLIAFLLSERGNSSESAVLAEIKALGATTMAVTNKADHVSRENADLLIEMKLHVPELARLAPAVIPAQLLGLYTGLKKGLNPDKPRNLKRVVRLDEDL